MQTTVETRAKGSLVRTPVSAVIPGSAAEEVRRVEIAKTAKDVLGYGWLDARMTERPPRGELQDALFKLESYVYTNDSVAEYKDKIENDSRLKLAGVQAEIALAEAQVIGTKEILNRRGSQSSDFPIWGVGTFFSIVGSIATAILAAIWLWGSLDIGWPATIGCLTLLVAGLRLGSALYLESRVTSKELQRRLRPLVELAKGVISLKWQRTALGSYQEEVPDHVLEKAIALKRICPKVELSVDHTVQAGKPNFNTGVWSGYVHEPKRRPDPFLVAKLGAEEYFIDVWDEADYKVELAN